MVPSNREERLAYQGAKKRDFVKICKFVKKELMNGTGYFDSSILKQAGTLTIFYIYK